MKIFDSILEKLFMQTKRPGAKAVSRQIKYWQNNSTQKILVLGKEFII